MTNTTGAVGTDLVPKRVPIIGNRDEVAMVLRVQHERGRLLTDPAHIRPVMLPDGRYQVDVQLLVKTEPRTQPPAPHRSPLRALADARRSALAFGDRHPIVTALIFVLSLFGLGLGLIVALVKMLGDELLQAAGYAVGGLVVFAVFALISLGGDKGHKAGYGYHYTKCK